MPEGSQNSGHARQSDRELHRRLTDEQYHVTQNAGTARAFTGIYWDCEDDGTYQCVVCEAELFSSKHKYDSGSGWPSFWAPIDSASVSEIADTSHGMIRTEVVCATCGGHLGHVFPDGPAPTGRRYCMNSASMRLERKQT